MNRRLLILAAAATATAVPAFAQTASQPNAQTPAPAPNGTPAALSDAAKTHASKVLMIGHASLMMADLALDKARRPRVKEFAKFEHDEQTTVAEILKSMDPSLTPPQPPAEIAQALDRLKGMAPGEAFDREFISAQIQGHDMLRTIQEDYLKVAKNPDGINTTKLTLGMIAEHLTLLSDLKSTHAAAL